MKNIQVVLWTLVFLIAADVLVNVLFPYPYNSKKFPNFLQKYFEYGRSSEGKIRRMVAASDDLSAPITEPGWLDDSLFRELPDRPEPARELMIATYGGSFNQRISRALQRNHGDQVTVRAVSAPGGPLNWTYSAYNLDRGRHQADAAVLTIISFTAAKNTMGGQYEEFPAPYTRPLYFSKDDQLQRVDPVIQTLPQLRTAIRDQPELWNRHVQKIQQYDPYYNSWLFDESPFDYSSIARLLRRFYGTSYSDQLLENVYGPKGFNPESQDAKVMKLMVESFAKAAREDGIVPVVYLANAQGWSDHLHQLLEPTFRKHSIPYISSHTFVPTDDPRLFQDDGHFITEKDEEIADAILQLVRQEVHSATVVPLSQSTSQK